MIKNAMGICFYLIDQPFLHRSDAIFFKVLGKGLVNITKLNRLYSRWVSLKASDGISTFLIAL